MCIFISSFNGAFEIPFNENNFARYFFSRQTKNASLGIRAFFYAFLAFTIPKFEHSTEMQNAIRTHYGTIVLWSKQK